MSGFSGEVRQLILARSSGNCEVMAKGCTLVVEAIHHRRARKAGGRRNPQIAAVINGAANGLGVCNQCHSRCESYRTWARDNGFLISEYDSRSPGEVPVWWRCATDSRTKRLVLLGDNGDIYTTPIRKAM